LFFNCFSLFFGDLLGAKPGQKHFRKVPETTTNTGVSDTQVFQLCCSWLLDLLGAKLWVDFGTRALAPASVKQHLIIAIVHKLEVQLIPPFADMCYNIAESLGVNSFEYRVLSPEYELLTSVTCHHRWPNKSWKRSFVDQWVLTY
jgi:hypothetical protein